MKSNAEIPGYPDEGTRNGLGGARAVESRSGLTGCRRSQGQVDARTAFERTESDAGGTGTAGSTV
jgi:hypothetical protein